MLVADAGDVPKRAAGQAKRYFPRYAAPRGRGANFRALSPVGDFWLDRDGRGCTADGSLEVELGLKSD
jgi:hypothetical protein